MPQIELFAIDNPCVGVCQSAKNGYCMGCLRSREERQHWYQLSDSDKHRIIKLLARRRAKVNKHAQQKNAQLSLELTGEFNDDWQAPDLFAAVD